MYSAFIDHIVENVPEKIIEKSGGPFIRAISYLYPSPNLSRISYDVLELNAPWGISSGWADSISKMNALNRLGAGLVVSKTITYRPKYGNPYPRILRNKPSMINSMGLPNPGLKYWIHHLNKQNIIPSNYVFSIKGDTIQEWNKLILHLSKFNRPLELNLSCPNVKDGVMDLEKTTKTLAEIRKNNQNAHLYLKLSPQYSDEQLLELIPTCIENEYIQGVSLFNTYPVKNQNLGNPLKVGGLSGPKLYPRLVQFLPKIRKKYSNQNSLPIFAMGGISSFEEANYIYRSFDAIPLILTAFLMQGPLIFNKWRIKAQKYTRNNSTSLRF